MSWTKWNGVALKKMTEQAISEAVHATAEEIGAEADQQVPHDEGTLQRSKTIMKDPSDSTITHIGYGGGGVSGYPEVPYAVKWHETPANFQKGRKHNYLRDPVNSIGPQALLRNLKKVIK